MNSNSKSLLIGVVAVGFCLKTYDQDYMDPTLWLIISLLIALVGLAVKELEL